jgi:hypothetical protein
MSEPTIASMMNEFAHNAVGFAQDQYQINLDYSDESIQAVEKILDILHQELPRNESGEISEEASVQDTVDAICNMFGGYVGEVIRRQYGGEWKVETIMSDQPMVCLQVGGNYISPPAKVYKRLATGSGDDLWFYYQVVRQKIEELTEND